MMHVFLLRYNDILLKRLFLNGGAVYSPARLSLITKAKSGYPKVEEYTDVVGKCRSRDRNMDAVVELQS